MHMPDGYMNVVTAVGGAAVAAGGVWVSLKETGKRLVERQIPMAGLTAAFVFAVQMLNFPVGAGTSGHLLGGALAAILLGPWMGVLVVTVVVVVQALMFADGGIGAPTSTDRAIALNEICQAGDGREEMGTKRLRNG